METLLAVMTGAALAVAAGALVVARRARAAEDRARDELRVIAENSDADRRSASLALSRMLEGVLLFDPDGRTTLANPAIGQHLGTEPFSAEDLPPGLHEAVRSAAITHLISDVEIETAEPPARWLRGVATPVGDDDTVLLVVRDVTEARRLDAVRRDFVANASHELKTPLASILAAAETIHHAAREDPDALERFAAQLEQDAGRLSRIVSDLLDLSRLEGGGTSDAWVELDALARQEIERFETPAGASGIELALSAEPVRIPGSARDLALLVRNLVDNALRHTPRGGRVDVEVRAGDEEGVLTVSDTGIGIGREDLPRIFERFYRVDRARSRETGGTGLGLSIAKHVVENHGGRIDVSSELGRGTRFDVRLPAVR